MLILVAYDVATDTREGRRRLRRIAKVCQNHGQRVQKSLFECRVTKMQFEQLHRELLIEIDEDEDNLRLYRLPENYQQHIHEHGNFKATDFDAPLIL